MNRDFERVKKMFVPDGEDCDGPYWFLPNDRKTHSYKEWLDADRAYWESIEKTGE